MRVGVIHPIESLWLRWGPEETNRAGCEGMEERFQSVINWLLYGLIDFDLLCESLLPQLYRNTQDGRLHVGEMAYDVIARALLHDPAGDDGRSARAIRRARRAGDLCGGGPLYGGCVPLRPSRGPGAGSTVCPLGTGGAA